MKASRLHSFLAGLALAVVAGFALGADEQMGPVCSPAVTLAHFSECWQTFLIPGTDQPLNALTYTWQMHIGEK